MAAWAMCFGLGKVVKSGTTPNFIYTCNDEVEREAEAAVGRARAQIQRRMDTTGI